MGIKAFFSKCKRKPQTVIQYAFHVDCLNCEFPIESINKCVNRVSWYCINLWLPLTFQNIYIPTQRARKPIIELSNTWFTIFHTLWNCYFHWRRGGSKDNLKGILSNGACMKGMFWYFLLVRAQMTWGEIQEGSTGRGHCSVVCSITVKNEQEGPYSTGVELHAQQVAHKPPGLSVKWKWIDCACVPLTDCIVH